ncbi:AMP-binding protein [Mycobacterium sp. AZCC_0083]|uniref:AMP-binding protein n=1 Tax=Mycobacterium sp. AZCC_0083 TaxID=2735882 RepID=UPI00161C83DF|nr:AMP-binding protein [Mycobacterium sp. AZCC_0083]MBB5163607.1 long-subunit acyl-CoA synthetase (AMP-forming)/cation diffusion facilitator CzcD-associated flavoprotein CzcO [Mycobacterium sp. AZCC_0083]
MSTSTFRLSDRGATPRTTSVAIVGSGFGGLAAAIELKRSGFEDFVIFERASSVGGVWRENTYPGAACDVPSPIYSFSYALKPDWSGLFGKQGEIHRYLEEVAHDFGITEHIRFDTEVSSAVFDENTGQWVVTTAAGEPLRVDALVMATGQLSRPKMPTVEGLEIFGGDAFHSAQWRHDVDLTDKKVVVVGSGASAIQIVPAIAETTADLTVVQRSPNWVMWKSRRKPGALQTALMRRFGLLRTIHHIVLFLAYESRYPLVTRAANPVRKLSQWLLIHIIKRHMSDPDEIAAAIPDYRLLCNRLLLSNDWYPTLGRDDVHLVGSAVQRVTSTGVVTADGRSIDADVLIWCTGFKASEFLSPISIIGRDGIDLHAQWRHGAEAYLGISAINFPNMFMLFGPNTNSITNTIVFLLERQASYIRQALDYKEEHHAAWIDVSRETHDLFQDWLQKKLDATVFTDNCPGWYTNAEGKVTAMWPASHLAYARATARFHPERYVVAVSASRGAAAVSAPISATSTAAQTPSGPATRPFRSARSICELFDATTKAYADQPALHSTDGELTLTYRQYRDAVVDIAGALHLRGVRHGDVVALMFDNRPEFHLVDAAVMHLGATSCSVYNTSPVADIAYVLTNSGATLAICEEIYATKLAAAAPATCEIICTAADVDGTVALNDLPRPAPAEFDFEVTWRTVGPDDVLTLIYTSGTTGTPKGVELTHAAMLAELELTSEVLDFRAGDRVPSAMPMAHAAQRWGTHYAGVAFGLDVTCVDDVAALLPALVRVRPQIWGTVPRILEKITAGLQTKFAAETDLKKRAAVSWALEIGQAVVAARKADGDAELSPELATAYADADRRILAPIRQSLGLDQLRWLMVGAAPTPPHVMDFIAALGLNVVEVWGMSELGAVATINTAGVSKAATVGKPLRDIEVRIAADGEVFVRGPIVMRGYRGDPVQTAEAVDSDGWLATGDVGTVDADGYLSITDRKKELIVNAAGKNISPLRIEAALKAASPLIGAAVAIGDGRPFITALIVLDPEAAPAYAAGVGVTATALDELAGDDRIRQIIEDAVATANAQVSRVEQVKRHVLVGDVWIPGGAELTPTLKLRRKKIAERYEADIDALYSEARVTS